MVPHLVRAQSAYKDIRIHSFHHTHMPRQMHMHTHTHTFVFQSWTHSMSHIALFQSSMSRTLSFPVFKVQRGLHLLSSQQIPVPGNKPVLCINSNAIQLTVWTEHLIAVTSYIKHVFFSFTHTIKTTHILRLHSKQIMHQLWPTLHKTLAPSVVLHVWLGLDANGMKTGY